MKTIINLFGTSIRYWVCEMPREQFLYLDELRERRKEHWVNLFFDLDWLSQLGLSHWSDWAIQKEKTGLLCLPKSLIEIRKGRRMLEKFSAQKLINSDSLFELYRTREHTISQSSSNEFVRFILMQTEIGLVGKFKIDRETLRMDELEFELTRLENPEASCLLTSIYLNGNELVRSDDDTLVINSQIYFLNSVNRL